MGQIVASLSNVGPVSSVDGRHLFPVTSISNGLNASLIPTSSDADQQRVELASSIDAQRY